MSHASSVARRATHLALVVIHRRRERRDRAGRCPRHHHREFQLEVERPLGHRRPFTKTGPRFVGMVHVLHRHLTPAVIPADSCLEVCAPAEGVDGRVELLGGGDNSVVAEREAALAKPGLLPPAVPDDVEHARPGTHRGVTERRAEAGGANLLDLERDDVTVARKVERRCLVVEAAGHDPVDDGARRAAWIRVERVDCVAEGARSHRRHAAELPASEKADRRARENGRHQPARVAVRSVSASTSAERFSRHARSRSRSSGRVRETIAAASSAAFAAPGSPIANVPTGTPRGI
jgi:hypothetical protein